MWIQNVLSEGVQLWLFFVFFLVWSKYHYKRTIIGPQAKRHFNGVSLACRWWPNIESGLVALWLFRGSGPVLLRNPTFLYFSGGGGLDLYSPSGFSHEPDSQKRTLVNTWSKTQMKCQIMWNFIRVYTVCSDKNEKEVQFYLEIITCDPSMYIMDLPELIVSNHKCVKEQMG